jgi:hypothetical protein
MNSTQRFVHDYTANQKPVLKISELCYCYLNLTDWGLRGGL